MARTNPVPESERAICRRFMEFRKSMGFSRVALAGMLGIDSGRLASYEHARVPLRYDFADAVCAQFNISQRWLAEGLEPIRFYISVGPGARAEIPKGTLFSVAYQTVLKREIEGYFELYSEAMADARNQRDLDEIQEITAATIGEMTRDNFKPYFFKLIIRLFEWCPRNLLNGLYRALAESGESYLNQHGKMNPVNHEDGLPRGRESESSLAKPSTEDLTHKAERLDKAGMQSVLQKLIERLRLRTANRGGKRRLAAWLGVHPQCVTDWLSGRKEPGGETTLRLLHWVEQEESRGN